MIKNIISSYQFTQWFIILNSECHPSFGSTMTHDIRDLFSWHHQTVYCRITAHLYLGGIMQKGLLMAFSF